jgi:OmpA-OmpF porin, OOP family
MKRMLVAALAGLVTSAHAELDVPTRYSWVGGHLSEHIWDINSRGDDRLTRTTLPGFRAGKRFDPSWSVQASWERNNARFDITRAPATLAVSVASLRYHAHEHRLAGLEPYLGLAAGRSRLRVAGKDNDQTVVAAELGAQHALRPHWLLDVGARPLYGFDKEQWDVEVFLGLNLLFDIR